MTTNHGDTFRTKDGVNWEKLESMTRDAYEQTDWLGDIAREQTSPPDWNGVRSFLTHKPAVENSTDAVIKDLKDREAMGLKKYGEYVHESKDNMLQHLYEELLDAAIYIKTEINRRKGT